MTHAIVVLDAHPLNPGDLSWAALERLAPCRIYDHTPHEQVVARARGASLVLTNKVRLTRTELEALPDLRYIGVLATGYDVVDVRAAAERGVVVSNVPAYGTASVAQFTFALLLELCNHVGVHAEAARAGRWTRSGQFAYWERPLIELSGLTLGIVGLGAIGSAVARIATGFGMRVVAASSKPAAPAGLELEILPLDRVFALADVLTLHCPLVPETRQIVNAERLAATKRGALLINTARGGLVDEFALRDALVSGQLGGAALDVLANEPPPADHPLLGAPNCLVTPHMAWATRAARERLLETAIENAAAFIAGAPRNVVSRG